VQNKQLKDTCESLLAAVEGSWEDEHDLDEDDHDLEDDHVLDDYHEDDHV